MFCLPKALVKVCQTQSALTVEPRSESGLCAVLVEVESISVWHYGVEMLQDSGSLRIAELLVNGLRKLNRPRKGGSGSLFVLWIQLLFLDS